MADDPGEAREAGLLTDLYELTMAQAYLDEGLHGPAVFSLFVRKLPPRRPYLIACGLGPALERIGQFTYGPSALAFLRGLGLFSEPLLSWLGHFRFSGEIWAVPEGTPVFANEPLVEVIAPLAQAQLLETVILNHLHLGTLAATKASRVVGAAQGREVIDFGMRRMHGLETSLEIARAQWIAGVAGTSNVKAAERFGIPAVGTMAHSYIEAHPSELEAFRAFTATYPEATLLVDTYDTLAGVRNVIRLAVEQKEGFRVGSIRLDSGDPVELSIAARRLLDGAGLGRVRIVASGGLDEHQLARCVAAGAPIDAFGVGTSMGVSADAPALDIAYKLVAYDGQPRMKLSSGKVTYPLRKQVWRQEDEGRASGDCLAGFDEPQPGRALLRCVMREGRPLAPEPLAAARARCLDEQSHLPSTLHGLGDCPPYPVRISPGLERARAELTARLRSATADAR